MNLLNKILFVLLIALFVFPATIVAQTEQSINQLKDKLKQFEQRPDYLTDSGYASTLIDLAYLYTSSYPDSAVLLLAGNAERCKAAGYKKGEVNTYMFLADAYATKGMYDVSMENYDKCLQLAKKINYEYAIPLILNRIGIIDLNRGNYPEALSQFYESLKLAENIGDDELVGATLNNIANVQFYQNKFSEAESTFTQQLKVAQKNADTSGMSSAYNSIGEVNLQRKYPAKALYNLNIAYSLASAVSDLKMLMVSTLSLAEVYYEMDSLQKADSIFKYALQLSKQMDDGTSICNALTGLAKTQLKRGLLSEALANASEALQKARNMGQVQLIRDASETLSAIYESMHDGINALTYYKLYKVYDDSMNNMASQRAVAIEKASYDFSKKEGEFQRKTLQQQWLLFSAFTGVVLLAVILWIIIRNRNRLKHTHKELQHKNTLIENQKLTAEETLFKLQATQRQLIQSEKMASLGQLTAGIAHEIQNPLNFVNNFSEINTELIDELKEEADKGNIDEVKAIAEDLKENELKIIHHGKRADSIVKGMLEHSRANTGKKELTDVNALVDECVRLSYHGMRAKDKEFNVEVKTDLDGSIGKINFVPQDISRVLINLLNNAFYAVDEKKKEASALKGDEAYSPIVSVCTKKLDGKVQIHIQDNGNGIPLNIVDKIFQPFFTTKPTGQGTGLGLSLSYDIVKAHGGEINVNSKEGEGTEFIVVLPTK